MTDLRAALSHVIWIGGGPMVGKSTLARLLAEKHSLSHYDLDEHGASEHRRRPGEATLRFEQLTMDERWLRPDPTALLERSIAIWSERFALVIEDLLGNASIPDRCRGGARRAPMARGAAGADTPASDLPRSDSAHARCGGVAARPRIPREDL